MELGVVVLPEQVAYPDVGPVLLLSEASVDHLNSRLDQDVTAERFRPNIVIGGCQPFEEVIMTHVSSRCSRKRGNARAPSWGGLLCSSCVGTRIVWSRASDSRRGLFSVSCAHYFYLHLEKTNCFLIDLFSGLVGRDPDRQREAAAHHVVRPVGPRCGSVRAARRARLNVRGCVSVRSCVFTTVDPETGVISRTEPLQTLRR